MMNSKGPLVQKPKPLSKSQLTPAFSSDDAALKSSSARERVRGREIRSSLEVQHPLVISRYEWTLEEHQRTASAGPSCVEQRFHFGVGLVHGSEAPFAEHNHQLRQHPSALQDELEEGELATLPSEGVEDHQLKV